MNLKFKKEQFFSSWQKALKDKLFLVLNIINCLLVVGLFVFLYYMFGMTKDESIVLHYNIYFGIDLIGQWYRVFELAYLGLGIFLLNVIIGGFIYLKDKILTIFLTTSTFFCLIFLLLTAWLMVYMNS
jgi:hypothetical protein